MDFYLDTSPTQNVKGLLEHLTAAFSLGEDETGIKSEFYSREQLPKETEDDFVEALQILAHKILIINPNFQSECNSALINQFASGLHDDIMRPLARELISRRPEISFVKFRAEIANKRAMKNIKAIEAKNKRTSKGKDFDVPVGNLVLLRDHPEGRNKIQVRNKSELYIVVCKGECPNNFWIKPLGSNVKPKEVNRWQIFDVGTMQESLVKRKEEEKEEKEDQEPTVPWYNPKMKIEVPSGPSHQYNLCPQPKPLPQKSVSRSCLYSSAGSARGVGWECFIIAGH